MAHNDVRQTNPEEAAAEAARIAAEELRQAAAKKEIRMTTVKGAEGENDILMPGDAENQVKWVTSEFNTGKLTETQRSNLKPEAQAAYADWLAAREARANREEAVAQQKETMASDARTKVEALFDGGGSGEVPIEVASSPKPAGDRLPTTRLTTPSVAVLPKGPRRTEISRPGRGFDAETRTPAKQSTNPEGNGHELVPATEAGTRPAPKVVDPSRLRPSPRSRTGAEQKPVTNVDFEQKSTEQAGSPADTQTTEQHARPAQEPRAGERKPRDPRIEAASKSSEIVKLAQTPEGRKLGLLLAEAQGDGNTAGALEVGRRVDDYLTAQGITGDAARAARIALVREGGMYARVAHQADLRETGQTALADQYQKGLSQQIAQQYPDASPQEVSRRVEDFTTAARQVREEAYADQINYLAARVTEHPNGPQSQILQRQLNTAVETAYPHLGNTDRARLVHGKIQEAIQKAAAGEAALPAEAQWPLEDEDTKPIARSIIDTADGKPNEQAPDQRLHNLADHYAAAMEASGRNPDDPRVIAAARRIEQTLRDQYPDASINELRQRAQHAADEAKIRLTEARKQAQVDAEQTSRIPRSEINDVDEAANRGNEPLTPQEREIRKQNRNLARRFVDIPSGREYGPRQIEARQNLLDHLADKYPGESKESLNSRADQLITMATQEAAFVDRAYEAGPNSAERLALFNYINEDPLFADATAAQKHAEMGRLLGSAKLRAQDRADQQAFENLFDQEQEQGHPGPDDGGAGAAGAQQPPRPRGRQNHNTGNHANDSGERYEHYDRLLESLRRFNNNEELSDKERTQLLRDLYDYSRSENQSQENRDNAAMRFEQVMEGMSKREQNRFRNELAEEARTDANDDRFRRYFRRPFNTWRLRRGNAKERRATARGLRFINAELGVDANGDTYEDLMNDVPEGGFNEGDIPMIYATGRGLFNRLTGRYPQPRGEQEVDEVNRQALRVLSNPNVSPADKQAISEYRDWLNANYQNFDWNQLSGNQETGLLPLFMRRPSRRNYEPGIVDELSNMIVDAARRTRRPQRPQNNNGPSRPQGGRPGPAGPTGNRFRPGQPPVMPQPGSRPQGPPQPPRPRPFQPPQ